MPYPSSAESADPRGSADFVIRNGTVLTLDRAGRRASALAARHGRILAVGGDREISELAGPDTVILDLAGRTAIPGFVESHSHPVFFGLSLAAAVDAGTPPNESVADLVERVAQAVRDAGPGEWIRGYRYDDTLLSDARHPGRADLDPVSPDNPVLLTHVSGHFCVANSAALRSAGITADTPDPPGGRIARDEHGAPSGLLIESAAFLVSSRLPGQDAGTLADALRLAGAEYARHGVTSVHDTGIGLVGGHDELAAYRRVRTAGQLRTRMTGYLFHELLAGMPAAAPGDVTDAGDPDDRFRLTGIKLIADGSLQGLTGCLADGYTCAPGEHGMMLLEPEDLARRIAAYDGAGWQVAVHGNGDAAIEAIIDAYARLGTPPGRSRRHRIEHCQTVREDQLARMAGHDVLASFFIKHVYYWGDRHRDRFLGPERARRISPLASARRAGVRFGLHSDTPVTPVPPLEGIWCAVARRTRDGFELGPEQAVDVTTALRGYTAEAAYLAGEEADKGTLEPGKLADLTILTADPTTAGAERLRAISVAATIVGGEVVYSGGGTQ
ncbi:amidohydrolase [Amycolatopsis jiangsuensis]|uniref:Putative amidohydrolase YtcJ n=1 Tax=Amycolatopsis jiangsuensis TaxID=1181879 RepID=A0A840IRK8_9PSEU|nr:amidohydrolase [Amycolatopsis jiangsuensis]MBB4684075.1 putative amidohydrolase YtcJ [Amycolatopsis jiangsuensis]